MLLAQYGDGYEQRLQDGINTRGLTVTAIWGALTHADADTIVAFFEARAGVEPFTYTMPPSSRRRAPRHVRSVKAIPRRGSSYPTASRYRSNCSQHSNPVRSSLRSSADIGDLTAKRSWML